MAKEKTINTDAVNLLVGILINYPEIGKVYYEPKDDALHIMFILRGGISQQEFGEFEKFIAKNLEAYYSLEDITGANCKMTKQDCGKYTFIQVVRDINTISRGELSLLSELIKDYYAGRLSDEDSILILEDDVIIQDDFIDNMLNNLRINKVEVKLIGLRENGRVMIFNK